ncbi:acylneuraminate cytidylyltransferase family protein [Pelagibacterales bacterium SAG-MED15]|nr:acylneuraminate cytidylyltransferase family protein [Pelagibacterales bacterium SAG-MED15]
MKKTLAVILARAGSKGLKNKNLRKLGNKPLVSWSIDEAKKSKKIDTILLSTDSTKIAKIGKRKKINVPFLRPKNLSEDKTPSVNALEHSINFLKDRGKKFDYILLLEPTSPFRSYKDIDNSLSKIIRSNASSLVSICKTDSLNPLFLFKKRKEFLVPIKKTKKKYLRRQDVEPTYFLEGSIYISKISTLLKKRTFCHNDTIGYEVSKWKSIEIDDILDLELAKIILKNKKLRKSA